MRRASLLAGATVLLIGLAGCGGGSGGSATGITSTPAPAVNNVQPVVADYGPVVGGQFVGFDNVLYTTVTICMPGTTTCQNIDHIQIDTGSTGLRILSSAIALTLPVSTDASGNAIGNCIQYADTSYQWGPVAKADVKMAGEGASSVPVQVVGVPTFPVAPSSCSAGGFPVQTVIDLGANGILGVGLFRQDCGPACASSAPPGFYYSCPAAGCTPASVALSSQLQNPVWMFSQDNNGLAIVLQQIGAAGAVSTTGSMIFGIGTQSNNALGSAQAQAANLNTGNFTTTFNGVAYTNSFIDSGSDGLFFLDSPTTGLPNCSSTSDAAGLYCPPSLVNLNALTSGPNPNGSKIPVSQNVAFSIANALPLVDSTAVVFNNLGGPNPGQFDWGLPFFFGRTVFIGIEGQPSPAGTGPYWAY